MTNPVETASGWSAKKPVLAGFSAILVLVVGLGVWGNITKIAGAIVASGLIQVESFRQIVQHPEGGVVGQINVKDGDSVDAGDVLIRFDDRFLSSQIALIESQLAEVSARKARLTAMQDEQETISFPKSLLERANQKPEVNDIVEGQRRLFFAQRESMQKEEQQLEERKGQIKIQIGGTEAQLASTEKQIEFVELELKDQQDLLAKGLAQATRVLSLQRELARLQGTVGELQSAIAGGAAQMIETDIQILRLGTAQREQAISELREMEVRELEFIDQLFSARETLSRLDVRAPVAGVVYGMQVFALRSVVRAADPIMYIIPQDQPFVIQSKVEAIHVDQVHIGQEAALRFSTFDLRTTPEIYGTVARVSADVFQDEITGVSYYSADILPKEGELEKLGDVELLPGMPVEAFIKTDERTPVSYLIKPLADYFNRAFREN
ncbi:HlyD family type I secretion periplasmic adaptor subunit [Amylibacter ulvae]|uniref:Membrane fusion protein (MFP) family protein n=1 Tax=Paramylibacter ulvae TaxID=1651968 RepID=A0ABQ3D6Z5_9RHOB|nr:HlyD family type I secretion periplasmic adaptor subunit [Amylibacter ulvae]GHA59378.1 HlyD family type I secretion periplasmic adaptor subunit [Amylibacter ulvae]